MTYEMPPWVDIAERYLGQHEIAGGQDNAFIVKILQVSGLPPEMLHDETAWCGAFAGFCLSEAGIRVHRFHASAVSFAENPDLYAPLSAFRPGCVAVFNREGGHHVAFALAELRTTVAILGGNQQNRVGIDPRAKSLLHAPGYFWPTGVP